MDEAFLQFLVLKEGTLIYGREKLYYLQDRDMENYFKKSTSKKSHIPKTLKTATALSVVLIFVFHMEECYDFILKNAPLHINFGDLMDRCFLKLKKEKRLSVQESFLVPSIQKVFRKHRESFCGYQGKLYKNNIEVPPHTIMETFASFHLFASYISSLNRHRSIE